VDTPIFRLLKTLKFMSAVPQLRVRESESVPTAAAPTSERENPVELLRDAIARLKSSEGGIPDQSEIATLLAEAREALERANVIAHATGRCEQFLREARFGSALGALDEALLSYPADPVLVARRREVERQQTAYQAAAAVRSAFEEASWFLEQDRADLAVQSLREKSAELPDQTELASRLEELEALLPGWTQKRDVQATLTRAATLEQMEQWQAALTVLEEALQTYPACEELIAAGNRVQGLMSQHERQKKLARRVDSIGLKIAGQSWKQALMLLEQAQKEFPHAPELKALRRQVDAAVRRAECESLVAEVRQYLADGDLEQADQLLRKGRKSFGPEPVLDGLRAELEADRKYRESLCNAQVLFGRRQLQEAERILTDLAMPEHPEACARLDAVREARAASDEEKFFDRGREKALELVQQGQFAEAVDLFRNLLALFPGNPILERDLAAAQSALSATVPEIVPVTEEPAEAQPAITTKSFRNDNNTLAHDGPSRFRRAAIVGTASLVLVSASAAAWKFSHSGAAFKTPARPAKPTPFTAAPAPALPPSSAAPTPAAEPAPPQQPPDARTPVRAASAKSDRAPASPQSGNARTGPLRQFVPPEPKTATGKGPLSTLPQPPGNEPVITAENHLGVARGVRAGERFAGPPAAASPADAAAAAPAQRPLPVGGNLQEAVLVTRPMPPYPQIARVRGIFGTVRLSATVDEHGVVKNVSILSGDPVLAAAAKQAVLQWKYKPATLNGQPITTTATIQIAFGDRNK
jgi:protein TonB